MIVLPVCELAFSLRTWIEQLSHYDVLLRACSGSIPFSSQVCLRVLSV